MNHPIILIVCIGTASIGLCSFVAYLEKTNVADMTRYKGNDWRNGLKDAPKAKLGIVGRLLAKLF